MHILIVNDDGVRAEGIAQLARHAVKFGTVTVVAPASQCSAMSHRLTLSGLLRVEKIEDFPVPEAEVYSVAGTPADCVKTALDVILDQRPDVVFSGINYGYNVGFDTAYSGTVAAAMQALMNGIPAIAFSRDAEGTAEITEAWLDEIIEQVLSRPISKREIWNVNFPGCVPSECKGVLWDRVVANEEYYKGTIEKVLAENGYSVRYPLELTLDFTKLRGAENSDLYAVIGKYISVGKLPCAVL